MERRRGRGKKEKENKSDLPFPSVRKAAGRRGEVPRRFLSRITSVGAAPQHYLSKPLCLCLSFFQAKKRLEHVMNVSRMQLHTGTHADTDAHSCVDENWWRRVLIKTGPMLRLSPGCGKSLLRIACGKRVPDMWTNLCHACRCPPYSEPVKNQGRRD